MAKPNRPLAQGRHWLTVPRWCHEVWLRFFLGLAAYCVLPALAQSSDTAQRPHVVSLAPHTTEILFFAGADPHILAVDNYSDYPDQARRKQQVGSGIQINHEALLALRPDHVWAWQTQQISPELVAQLTKLGTQVRFIQPKSLQDIVDAVRLAGQVFMLGPRAQQQADALQLKLDQLEAIPHQAKRPLSVFIEAGTEPLYTLGNDPLTRHVLRTCGASNIYEHYRAPALTVNLEDILKRRPQIVITAYKQAETATARHQFWQSKLALADKAIINIDPDHLFRPGPRLILAVETLCDALDQYRHSASAQVDQHDLPSAKLQRRASQK